jgi:8-oxo-dGTP pyrophosphatase MutT (NUDIX family)
VGSGRPLEPGEDLPLSPDADRLEAALARRGRGPGFDLPGARRAAVLVPLVERDGETRVVLTLRAPDLRAHAGQWSFPGGACEDGDAHVVAAALREAEEEVGIAPASARVLGLLGDVPTSTRWLITPVVAVVAPAPSYRPNPREVAEIAEIPLAAFGAPETIGIVERGARRIPILAFPVGRRNIWGATARILAELLEVVRAVPSP